MTTYKLYRCNLCSDYIQPSDGTSKEGFGVYFVAGGVGVFKRPHEAERHICNQCAKSVHDELRKITPAGRSEG